jgi:hypothetical protein
MDAGCGGGPQASFVASAGLLDQTVDVVDRPQYAEGVLGVPAAISVDDQALVSAHGRGRGAHARDVLHRPGAYLDLKRAKALPPPLAAEVHGREAEVWTCLPGLCTAAAMVAGAVGTAGFSQTRLFTPVSKEAIDPSNGLQS